MSQSIIAGIILILFGLILEGKPGMILQAIKKWNDMIVKTRRATFNMVTRMIGGIFLLLGVLLIFGIIH